MIFVVSITYYCNEANVNIVIVAVAKSFFCCSEVIEECAGLPIVITTMKIALKIGHYPFGKMFCDS